MKSSEHGMIHPIPKTRSNSAPGGSPLSCGHARSGGRKRRIALFCAILILFMAAAGIIYYHSDERSLHKFTRNYFLSELTGNTLNMHYTVADPSHYGIRSYEAVLPVYSARAKEQSILQTENAAALLQSINPRRLKDGDRETREVLLPYLNTELAQLKLYYYAEPFSPSSGMQSQLPILLAEYAFRSKRDVDDYLSILDQTGAYFDSLIVFEQEKSGKGLFMPDYSADKVIEQCSAILDKESLEGGTHFLDTTFSQRLESLLAEGLITEQEKEAYLADNDRLLTTVMLPAYERCGDALLLLKGSGKNENGLFYYPEGKEYYLNLLRSSTGSYREMREIKQMLYEDFKQSFASLGALAKSHPDLALRLATDKENSFLYTAPEDMLADLQKMMQEDYPAFPSSFGDRVSCRVKNISGNLEKYCSPAFYLTPPLDDMTENVIYINQKNHPSGVSLYTTLAHEGYPGHLYQTVYTQQHLLLEKADPVRSLLSYGGYVEGWAMYVELHSYDYAKQLMHSVDPATDYVYEAYKLDRSIQLGLYSLLDIAIHYEGATYEQVHRILSSVGITSPSVTRSIYEYIVEEPANYLKYYLGYLEILSLRDKAKQLWGDDFTLNRFHRFYLENGPADFTSLEQWLQ